MQAPVHTPVKGKGSATNKNNWENVLTSTPGSITIDKVELYDASAPTAIANSSCSASTKIICKANMTYKNINEYISPYASFSIDSFSYNNIDVGADTPYGYAGNTIEVKANPASPYILEILL